MAGRSGRARLWLSTPLFRSYLGSFLVLWGAAKAMLTAHAWSSGLDPSAFQPYLETWACALELLVLAHFVRRRGEDVLLGNLGLDLADALLPLALAHFVLSGIVAAAAR